MKRRTFIKNIAALTGAGFIGPHLLLKTPKESDATYHNDLIAGEDLQPGDFVEVREDRVFRAIPRDQTTWHGVNKKLTSVGEILPEGRIIFTGPAIINREWTYAWWHE